ncbi:MULTISPECIES: hypothetical protein [Gordonia]|uniref:ABC transporter n=1 Tax=Gordonia sihwensis NBRC 108236 TaxID=1223544 RepID=L7LF23_9ACTN|nr:MULTISPECIES: hypothetical protein [Gordonia]AUH68976.1 hypothetical protein CXX93_12235 [Gordonia sp. YC-JH1]KXT56072.1 hypothetical protein Y710_15905 [Gordonia sp. QH-12]GAC59730.1 hypothetical protein GSI01S_05_00490 [Gordonia sihwensis NBRC 108236]
MTALATSTVILAAGCGADEPAPENGLAGTERPHGYVEGAKEKSEPQIALAVAARNGKKLSFLDPAEESTVTVDLTTAAQRLDEDGRFVYVIDGDTLEVVDSGGWTVDHGDHVHYYRATTKPLGTLTVPAAVTTVSGADEITAVGARGGSVTVLDRRGLENGSAPRPISTIDTRSSAGFAVPYADGLVLGLGDGPDRPASRVVFTDRDGNPRRPAQPCVDPQGPALLRNAVAVSCAEAIILFTDRGGEVAAQVLDYGRRGPRAGAFGVRPRSNRAVAATAAGSWLLDSSAGSLRWVPSADRLSAALAPGRDETLIVLTDDGELRTLAVDPATGAGRPVATAGASAGMAGKVLTADTGRAYLSEPTARAVHEFDYGDSLRRTRTLPVDVEPELMVEVGR